MGQVMQVHVLKDWVCNCLLFHRAERQTAEVSEESSGISGLGLLPECLDPGGLIVNSLSVIELGLELELKRK